jgi:hypothetical protein
MPDTLDAMFSPTDGRGTWEIDETTRKSGLVLAADKELS